ncbi:MAG: hypothetical protein EPN92_08930, partial [Chitinophagaceae bacterium]
MKTANFLLSGLLIMFLSIGRAQDSIQTELNKKILSDAPGNTKFVLTGAGWFGFSVNHKEDVKFNFNSYGFAPVFLWKLSDKLFFEGEIEIDDGEFELEFAKLSYSLNKYMTIGAGRMLTPFGAYAERWEPAFVERFPNDPIRAGGPYLPGGTHLTWGAIMGVDVRGGIPLGNAKMNYSLFVSNGSSLTSDGEEAGMIDYENLDDNNSNKEIGGRIGFLPISNSSLEIGVSLKSGKAGNETEAVYKNIGATAFAVDWNYIKSISSLKSIIGVRGQFNTVTVDKVTYLNDTGSPYTFDNTMKNYFAQFSFRPALSDNSFLKNIEFLYRYNSLTAPKDAEWGPKDAAGNGGKVTR